MSQNLTAQVKLDILFKILDWLANGYFERLYAHSGQKFIHLTGSNKAMNVNKTITSIIVRAKVHYNIKMCFKQEGILKNLLS